MDGVGNPDNRGDDGRLVGESAEFRATICRLERFAGCDAPALILGETGTGKELAAAMLHRRSARGHAPFVAVNVAALPESLLVNELFGHEQGAFTGANTRARGLIEQADGGTLFLDEIDGLPLSVQAALLRFLQDQEYRPLGGGAARRADLRIVAASNADLAGMVRDHGFREDLYYRINVLSISLPPLRERTGDLEVLTEHFLDRLQGRYGGPLRRIGAAARAAMRAHSWPGNVRELENRLHRGFLLTETDAIGSEDMDLPPVDPEAAAAEKQGRAGSFASAKALAVARFERKYIDRLLRETRGNVSEASRLAKKERRAFTRLIEKHGIDRRAYLVPQD